MNTKYLILIACFLFPLLSRSQDHAIKMNIGLARTTILYEPEVNNEFKTGINLEFNYIRKISSYFFISGGLGFIQNGDKSDLFLSDVNGNSLGVSELIWKYNYINFPLNFGLNYGDNYYFLADLGILPSLLLKSEVNYSDVEENVTDQIDNFDISGRIRIGVGKYLKGNLSTDINLAYQQSLRKTELTNVQIQHLGFIVNIGISYKLSENR